MYKKGFLAKDSSLERTDLFFFFFTIDHCIGSPHNAATISVRDQPWVRVRGPAGPRTVTKMSKISGDVSPAWGRLQFPAWAHLQSLPGTLASSLPGNACQCACPAWACLQSLPGTLGSSLPGNAWQFPAWERLPMPCLGTFCSPCLGLFASSQPENVCQFPAWASLPVLAWDACQFPAWEPHLLGRRP